ncbi:NAD(P)-dependent alcohol dehydrogenase [Mycolicibacterium sp.]|uniref:NAD(P)-dependent alcohol dehydrogenase n=1 Tax=Mycolicibacterium sp. TaxID=2320850 RepID=UPI003D0DC65F
MHADVAVLPDPGSPFVIERIELPELGADEVLVRIAGAGMCHTDLLARSLPPEIVSLPAVLGHEGAGVVEQVGPYVTQVAVGDHVLLSYDSCGWCRQCLTGAPSYCDEFGARNVVGVRGTERVEGVSADGTRVLTGWFAQSSFATYSIATQRNVVKVDKELPLEILGPLGCGLQTGAGSILNSMDVRYDSSVAVFGTGAVGLAAVMAARIAGATVIAAVDINPARRELAAELGATHVFDGADPEVAEQIRAVTGGGTSHAFDTTGIPAVILTALASIRPLGFCGLVGGGGGPIDLPQEALNEGRRISFLLEGDAVPQLFIPKLIELWRLGRFPFDRLVTTYPLDKINDAEADSLSGVTVKPILIP